MGAANRPMSNGEGRSVQLEAVLERFVRGIAHRIGAAHGLVAAEEFRVVTFGGMGELLNVHGVTT